MTETELLKKYYVIKWSDNYWYVLEDLTPECQPVTCSLDRREAIKQALEILK